MSGLCIAATCGFVASSSVVGFWVLTALMYSVAAFAFRYISTMHLSEEEGALSKIVQDHFPSSSS